MAHGETPTLEQADWCTWLEGELGRLQLSRRALAEQLGVSRATVQRWLKRAPPRASQLSVRWTLREFEEASNPIQTLRYEWARELPDVIWVATFDMEAPGGIDLDFVYHSPSVTGLRDLTPAEANAIKGSATLTPDSWRRAQQVIEHQFANLRIRRFDPDRSFRLDLELIDRGGRATWVEANVRLVLDEHDQPRALVGVSRDINDTKLRAEMLKAIFEDAPFGILLVERQGTILDANPAFLEVLGYDEASELQGTLFIDITMEEDRGESAKNWEKRTAGGELYRIRKHYLHRDPRREPLLCDVTVVPLDIRREDSPAAVCICNGDAFVQLWNGKWGGRANRTIPE